MSTGNQGDQPMGPYVPPEGYANETDGKWSKIAARGRASNGIVARAGRATRSTVKWVLIVGLAALALIVTGIGLLMTNLNHHVAVDNGHEAIERKQCSDYKEPSTTYMLAPASLTNGSIAGYVSYDGSTWHPVTVGGIEQMDRTVDLPDSAMSIQC